MSWHCSSSYFVCNFHKTPCFSLMCMVRFVTFICSCYDNYFAPTWEIHLKILQSTPWEPVVNKVHRSWSNGSQFLNILCSHTVLQQQSDIFKPINGREISISVFGRTRRTRLYLSASASSICWNHKKYLSTSTTSIFWKETNIFVSKCQQYLLEPNKRICQQVPAVSICWNHIKVLSGSATSIFSEIYQYLSVSPVMVGIT